MQPQGRYTILGEIASGGTATVFLAEDRVLRRKVALKKLHPHLLNHPEVVRRFEKEAVAVASLSHENVIKIFDFGREDKGVFLAMEYVDGPSLEGLIRNSHGRIPNLSALALFHQLIEGLAAAHALGICHRDIKPSNVLIDRKGCVRIADFGIAFLSEETSITRTGAYLGTPGYSAPEQAEGRPVTEKTDIFACGTLLYRCLTGCTPFAADSAHAMLKAIVEKKQPKANLINPRILPGLADLAQEMLAKLPEDRPGAEACLRRLEEIASGLAYPIDPHRLLCLLEDPEAAAEKECRDLATRFARQARVVDKLGKTREAMKLYALAEVFSEKESEVGLEANRFVRRGAVRTRLASALAFSFILLGTVALAVWTHSHARAAMPPPASATPFAKRAAPAPYAPELSLPVAVPAWPTPPIRNLDVAPARLRGRPDPAVGAHGAPAPTAAAAPARLEPPQGYFWVKTNPPFAHVVVDGKEVGATPMPSPIRLPEGTHSLELQRADCKPMLRQFQVSERDTVYVRVTLDKLDASP